MNERECKAEIEALKQRIAELERTEIEADGPPHPRYMPENGVDYFEIMSYGRVSASVWTDSKYCQRALDIGNVFRTQKEAEFALERLKVLAEMREWAGKWNDEFNLRYEKGEIETFCQALSDKSYGEMRFATKEDALNCINAVGEDRIKKYYFMIPEEANND